VYKRQVLTPTFFVGATAGATFARLTGSDPILLSVMGFTAVLAGAANTPITASIMAMEIMGPQATPLAAIACVLSFVVSGHRSIYPTQVLARPKSKVFEIPPYSGEQAFYKVKILSSKIFLSRYIRALRIKQKNK